MKTRLQARARFIAVVLLFLFTVGGALLVIILRGAATATGSSEEVLSHVVTGILLSIIAGISLSLYLFLGTFHTGITRYLRLIQRLPQAKVGGFSLKGIHFPEGDEYGDLGKHLNKLIGILDGFDSLKSARLAAAEGAMRRLAERLPMPLVAVSSARRVLFTNSLFLRGFGIERLVDNYLLEAVLSSATLLELLDLVQGGNRASDETPMMIRCRERDYHSLVVAEPVLTSEGELLSVLLFFREINPATPLPFRNNR